MSDTLKIRNKLTGEVVTIRRVQPTTDQPAPTQPKEDYSSMVKRVGSDIQGDIAKRGDYLENIASNMQSPNNLRKGLGVLQASAIPAVSMISGVSNPMLQMQQGDFNPNKLAEEAFKGFTMQKLGNVGDVYRGAGMEKNTAGLLGFGVETLTPFTAINKISKTFGKLALMSDKKLLSAGGDLIKAGDAATSTAGNKLNVLFRGVDQTQVDQKSVLDAIDKLPKPIYDRIDKEVDILNNLTVGGLRKIKQLVGKYSPTKFGKSDRGALENLADSDYEEVYGKLANILHDTINKTAGKKVGSKLIDAEKKTSEIIRSTQYLKGKLVNSRLQKATRAGGFAEELKNPMDVSSREAVNVIKGTGGEARKLVNNAISSLDSFHRWRLMQQIAQHGANAALFGGAVGGLGAYVGGKLYKRDGGDV